MRGEHRVERVFAVLISETCSVCVHIELFAVLIVGNKLLKDDFRIFFFSLAHEFLYPVKQLVKVGFKNSGFVFDFCSERRYLLGFVGNGRFRRSDALSRSFVDRFFCRLIYACDALFAVFYRFHRDACVECGAHQAELSAVNIQLILFASADDALSRIRAAIFERFECVFRYLIYISHFYRSFLSVRRYLLCI